MTLGRVVVNMIQLSYQYASLYLDNWSRLLVGDVYQEIFALIDKYNELNRPRLTQETGVDSKKNQESYYSVYGYGSAPRQLHKVSQS